MRRVQLIRVEDIPDVDTLKGRVTEAQKTLSMRVLQHRYILASIEDAHEDAHNGKFKTMDEASDLAAQLTGVDQLVKDARKKLLAWEAVYRAKVAYLQSSRA